MLDRISLESSRVLDGSRKSKNIDNAELVSYTFLSLTSFVIFSGIGYRYEPHYRDVSFSLLAEIFGWQNLYRRNK